VLTSNVFGGLGSDYHVLVRMADERRRRRAPSPGQFQGVPFWAWGAAMPVKVPGDFTRPFHVDVHGMYVLDRHGRMAASRMRLGPWVPRGNHWMAKNGYSDAQWERYVEWFKAHSADQPDADELVRRMNQPGVSVGGCHCDAAPTNPTMGECHQVGLCVQRQNDPASRWGAVRAGPSAQSVLG